VTATGDDPRTVPGPPGALFHIAEPGDWAAADTHYRAPSLDTEGFIHLSDAHQVRDTTDRHYEGRTGLLLLVIDPDRVEDVEIRVEAAAHGEAYAHLYGPLPVAAITEVRPWPE
jgi:uncharacterized protein (DUF952 family)